MTRRMLPLAAALALLAPAAAFAQIPPAPAAPPPPTAPAPPAPSAAPKPQDRLRGKIVAVDAVKKTVTISQHKVQTTVTLAGDAKIYKPGDARHAPTGTFADLVTGAQITARITGDPSAPTATEVHLRAPKAAPAPPPAAPAGT